MSRQGLVWHEDDRALAYIVRVATCCLSLPGGPDGWLPSCGADGEGATGLIADLRTLLLASASFAGLWRGDYINEAQTPYRSNKDALRRVMASLARYRDLVLAELLMEGQERDQAALQVMDRRATIDGDGFVRLRDAPAGTLALYGPNNERGFLGPLGCLLLVAEDLRVSGTSEDLRRAELDQLIAELLAFERAEASFISLMSPADRIGWQPWLAAIGCENAVSEGMPFMAVLPVVERVIAAVDALVASILPPALSTAEQRDRAARLVLLGLAHATVAIGAADAG